MATTKLVGMQEKLREILKCVACHAVPRDKVFQCPKGHLTCERCSASSSDCPLPRCNDGNDSNDGSSSAAPSSSDCDWIRNRAMEEAIAALKFPKRCRSEGCRFEGLGRDLMQHEKRCRIKKWTRRIDLFVHWYE